MRFVNNKVNFLMVGNFYFSSLSSWKYFHENKRWKFDRYRRIGLESSLNISITSYITNNLIIYLLFFFSSALLEQLSNDNEQISVILNPEKGWSSFGPFYFS